MPRRPSINTTRKSKVLDFAGACRCKYSGHGLTRIIAHRFIRGRADDASRTAWLTRKTHVAVICASTSHVANVNGAVAYGFFARTGFFTLGLTPAVALPLGDEGPIYRAVALVVPQYRSRPVSGRQLVRGATNQRFGRCCLQRAADSRDDSPPGWQDITLNDMCFVLGRQQLVSIPPGTDPPKPGNALL
jgi:hypothetical protein